MTDASMTVETLTEIRRWTPKLFSFRLTRAPGFRFRAGQFARLGLQSGEELIARAYTMVSAPHDDFLEFFSIQVPDGAFTSRLARLQAGDTLQVGRAAFGYLTLDRFVDGRDLWLLATGTGVAPFLSMLAEAEIWQRFERILLVYSVREAAELAYRSQIEAWLNQPPPVVDGPVARLSWLPIVTREQVPGMLSQRMTDLLRHGGLEAAAGLDIDPGRSRVMICGNPQMTLEMRQILQSRGLALSRLSAPAQLALEQFW
ncbi:ferredoxin--NADP reductase [Paludibacterium sp. THUN1379]|uniref:ferredoxin--NADP reductase n=1 Tax=Paludibacterium sp. THUN1379 TaxID=3112107 RepID=UPI00308E25C6|nr:ferredoxin--NADP reductase [Paludibacterium sp. THUN1379]